MKLYELERNSWFTINGDPEQKIFLFCRIDGMYSVCIGHETNDIVHIAAFTDVTVYDQMIEEI